MAVPRKQKNLGHTFSPIASTSSIYFRSPPLRDIRPASPACILRFIIERLPTLFGSFGPGKEAELHTETSPTSPSLVIHALTNIVPDELGGYRGDTHSLIRGTFNFSFRGILVAYCFCPFLFGRLRDEKCSADDGKTSHNSADSNIVMAEQSSHDVVNQTQSGGEISPSDVPANKPDNITAGGDAGGVQHNANNNNNDHNKTQPQPGAIAQESANDISGMLKSAISETPTALGYEANKHHDPNLENGNDRKPEINGLGETSHTGDDRLSPLQLGDASGGSDTDTSRTDLRSSADGNQHIRTSSVKRTSVFKPVSYAKFSVTKSPGSLQTSKTSAEKTPFSSASSTPSISQPAKPRLVAKSTGGLRDLTPKSTGIGNKNGNVGPDPNQVWNKNRPVQPPSTKHLTDEELKQQYGIHMTSRIQEDGNGKEAKWADIDDDEDDWAPETIEWNDGTKITLTHTENVPLPSEKEKDTAKDRKPSPPIPENKSKLLLSKTSSVGPNATILKLGAHSDKQNRPGESLTKGQNEKPTLTSKAQSAVHRSPWAPLPPIDKVPPVTISPTLPGPPTRFSQREPHGQAAPGPATSAPAKEIAADDFNRSWRDTHSTVPRELYNSQSGRYEPVLDTRRGPARNETNFRPPSLLQRPTHGEQPGPGEPSPTFQPRGSAADGATWGRRRTSSNVSGGSGAFDRRMSLGKAPVNGVNERPSSPLPHHRGPYPPRGISPSQSSTRQSRAGPPSTHYAPPGFHGGAPQPQGPPLTEGATQHQTPFEDPIAMQQRIMREKRELARQRRKEEEEREEAAKQERIRLKLQAMGVPCEKPSEKPSEQRTDHPSEIPAAEESYVESELSKQSTARGTIHSPPKPPVPELSGEPKQYGMMKVHHPVSAKKLVAASERGPDRPFANNQLRQPPSPSHDSKFESAPPVATNVNGVRPSAESSPTESRHESVMDEKPPQWKGALTGAAPYASWSGQKLSSHPAPTSSLWGPLSNDKALGNGTFDRNLTGFPHRDLPLTMGLPPAKDRLGGTERPRTMADNGRPSSPLSSPQERPSRLAISEPLKPIARPTPIGPPTSHSQSQRWQHDQAQASRRSQDTAGWNDFHTVAAKVEAEESEKFHRELTALREEEARTGLPPASLQVSFNETWRQVENDHSGQRQIVGITRTTDKGPSLPALHGFPPTSTPLPFSDMSTKPLTNTTGRESRFFPHGSDQVKRPTNIPSTHLLSPSPPPPDDISSHPVFIGDSSRPLVHLPAPKPRVKLPPRQASPPPTPATFAAMVAAPAARPAAQPVANTTSWQDRFNGLFGKKPSPVKNYALAVTSATKEPLEVQPSTSPASVSFPQYDEIELLRDAGRATSKDVEDEEAIFEDREAGSTPVVKMPIMAPKAAWLPVLPTPHSRLRAKYQKPVQPFSIDPYISGFFDDDHTSVTIHLPGGDLAKTLLLPKKVGSTSSRQRGPSTFKQRKNVKPREGSGNYGHSNVSRKHPQSTTSTLPRASQSGGSWANRASSAAH
ncbi:hypothetical protein AJ78_00659 [Emergomyces pasteurianus Ep9510]|uniref:Uncharacterized protein n=1 Tax=Emergomyces pasteurianus Ep9510 TaxID=1447872 RepID=A0A1J9QVR5_9EURO|nr:hypothetical protein AJ78_00659 [Emergomyces pasteurianus Ep9510]